MSEEKHMGVLEHLDELRSRLIIALVAILVTTSLAYIFSDTILYILRAPAGDIKLQAFSPLDGFMIKFRVALYGGIALAAPVWIYQLMRYLEPALDPKEKRFLIPGVIAMVGLFLLGNAFGYLMLQNMMGVLFSMFGSELNYLPSADQYISFVVYFLISTGIAFELPIALLILIKLGVVSPDFLRKRRKIVWFIIFVIAELITPVADPIVAPTVVMLPMVLLFEIALFLSRFIVPKPAPVAKTEVPAPVAKVEPPAPKVEPAPVELPKVEVKPEPVAPVAKVEEPALVVKVEAPAPVVKVVPVAPVVAAPAEVVAVAAEPVEKKAKPRAAKPAVKKPAAKKPVAKKSAAKAAAKPEAAVKKTPKPSVAKKSKK